MSARIEHGDMLQVIPRLVAEGIVCDACVTDPPYHLTPMLKRFGATNSAPAKYGRDGAMARLSGGFMGQQWDGGDIAFRPETWATVATILRPGAFLIAFGGTRTYHRLVCAIEDGGFIIQDQIAWIFATGFPKRKDMLKPAFEPLVLAYKPGGKRTMQIDECRIGTDVTRRLNNGNGEDNGWRFGVGDKRYQSGSDAGRWPANVCHDGSDEVVACFPQGKSSLPGNIKPTPSTRHAYNVYKTRSLIGHIDSGSAARFFFSAKAGPADRFGSRHPTVKPVKLMQWLVSLVTPPGRTVLDPFAGSGTTAAAAMAAGRNCILIEREAQYIADIRRRVAFLEGGGAHSAETRNRTRKRVAAGGTLFDRMEAAE